jgi:hypothetical protein
MRFADRWWRVDRLVPVLPLENPADSSTVASYFRSISASSPKMIAPRCLVLL